MVILPVPHLGHCTVSCCGRCSLWLSHFILPSLPDLVVRTTPQLRSNWGHSDVANKRLSWVNLFFFLGKSLSRLLNLVDFYSLPTLVIQAILKKLITLSTCGILRQDHKFLQLRKHEGSSLPLYTQMP